MKKALILAIFLGASLVSAQTISSEKHTLKIGESFSIASVQVTLSGISEGVALIDVTTNPPCGMMKVETNTNTNTSGAVSAGVSVSAEAPIHPCPLMMPSYVKQYKLAVGQSADLGNLKLTIAAIADNTATISVTYSYPKPIPPPPPPQSQTYTLKVGTSVKLPDFGSTISLVSIKESDFVTMIYPPTKPTKIAVISIDIEGGCAVLPESPRSSTETDDVKTRCLGAPSSNMKYEIFVGQTINLKNLSLKATAITDNSLTFEVFPSVYVMGSGSGVVKYGTVSVQVCSKDSDECSVCSNGQCKLQASSSVTSGIRVYTLPEKDMRVEAISDFSASSTVFYRVRGVKRSRALFFLPMNTEVTYTVDAETGVTTKVERPWWSYFLW